MVKTLLIILCCAAVASCNFLTKQKNISAADERFVMMEADRNFSELSMQKGMKHAFLEYIDSNGVLLRPNRMPIIGADAVDYLVQQNDSNYTLTWEPKSGVVAQSGELGYTYGIYTLQPQSKDTALYGTYITVWKKQKDGRWKFVLDSGNEGVSETEE